MFDAEIIDKLKGGTLIVSEEIAPLITESIESQDSVPVELESEKKIHLIGRQETLVLNLPEEVNFMNCRIIIKSKVDLEVLCLKTQRKWKIRQILSQSDFGGRENPAPVNI